MGLLGKPKASVDIQIDTYQFSPGDTVKGMVLVTINDAVTPKNLSITLDGSDLVSGYSFGRNTYQRIPLFHFILPLEKEKAFTPAPHPYVYPFQITIPKDVFPRKQPLPLPGGGFDKVIQAGQMIGALTGNREHHQYTWKLVAEMPIGFMNNPGKTIKLNVIPPSE